MVNFEINKNQNQKYKIMKTNIYFTITAYILLLGTVQSLKLFNHQDKLNHYLTHKKTDSDVYQHMKLDHFKSNPLHLDASKVDPALLKWMAKHPSIINSIANNDQLSDQDAKDVQQYFREHPQLIQIYTTFSGAGSSKIGECLDKTLNDTQQQKLFEIVFQNLDFKKIFIGGDTPENKEAIISTVSTLTLTGPLASAKQCFSQGSKQQQTDEKNDNKKTK